jgi:hypothetical protein
VQTKKTGVPGRNKESGGTTHSGACTDAALTIFVWRAHEQPDGPGEGGSVGGAGGGLGAAGRGMADKTWVCLGHDDAAEQAADAAGRRMSASRLPDGGEGGSRGG